MKGAQKVTRLKLEDSSHNDILLIGLVSSEPDYKLSLSLNKQFRISLKSISPVNISESDKTEHHFSRFSDTSNSPDIIFSLISNRSGKNFLLKKLKNVDYLLHIHDSENEIDLNQLTASLRETESVNAVFIIDTDTFKDKNLHHLTL
jgi:hypothetical protein